MPLTDSQKNQNEPLNLKRSGWESTSANTSASGAEEAGLVSNFISRFGRFGRWIFWLFVAATIIVIGVGSFYLYQYLTSRGVSMSLKAPTDVLIGVPFDISINFTNDSDKVLKEVELTLVLPEGTALAQSRPDDNKRFVSRDLGDLNPRASLETRLTMLIFKNAESVRRFPVTVSYYLAGLGQTARLEKNGTLEVGVREPAIKLDLSAPQKIVSGETFEIKMDYHNISDFEFSDVDIALNLPSNLSVKEANPSPTSSNLWKIGRLPRLSGGTITVKGNLTGTEGSFFEIKGSVRNNGYLIDEKIASLNIATSPLSLNIGLNGQTNYIARPDEGLRYTLTYQNNADISFADVVVKARLTGEMFDLKRLNSKGFFNSINNTITWNAANTPELRLVNPGGKGVVEFDIPTRPDYPIKRLSDKNFLLKVDAEISSPTVPYYVSADKTVQVANMTTKVRGYATIRTNVFFADAASGIQNLGPLPPKVNYPTNFTIHWLITNYSTDIKNIQVKSFLPGGIRSTGKTKTNVSSTLSYNDRTGEINWLIDKIPADKGVIGTPAEAIFQIEATPNLIQVGQPMPVLSETQLIATDDFTQSQIISSFPAVTTEMLGDSTFKSGQGMVVQ